MSSQSASGLAKPSVRRACFSVSAPLFSSSASAAQFLSLGTKRQSSVMACHAEQIQEGLGFRAPGRRPQVRSLSMAPPLPGRAGITGRVRGAGGGARRPVTRRLCRRRWPGDFTRGWSREEDHLSAAQQLQVQSLQTARTSSERRRRKCSKGTGDGDGAG